LHVEVAPAAGVAEKPADPPQTELPPALPMMAAIAPMYVPEPPEPLDPPLPPELLPEELPPEELPPPLLPPEELPPPLLLPELLLPTPPPELLLPLETPLLPPPLFSDEHAPSEAKAPMERQPRT
jgi:hypothetical protein